MKTSRRPTLLGAQQAFSDLSDILWEKFGGRVHLVKNVFASKRRTSSERMPAIRAASAVEIAHWYGRK